MEALSRLVEEKSTVDIEESYNPHLGVGIQVKVPKVNG